MATILALSSLPAAVQLKQLAVATVGPPTKSADCSYAWSETKNDCYIGAELMAPLQATPVVRSAEAKSTTAASPSAEAMRYVPWTMR